MNDQDKLYLELGANDKLSPIIEKILKDSEKLQENFSNFKKITIKDIELKTDGALTAIRKQIQESLNAEPFTIKVAPDIDTNRVTEAARAIIEAQEKIVNAASKGVTVEAEAKVNTTTTDTTGSTAANTQAAQQNAEAVQQQAKSYEELRAQVDAVLGSLAKNTATIVEEKNAISLIDKEMKIINKDVEKQGSMTENQRKRLEQLTAARERHKQALQSSVQSLRNDIKLAQAADGSMNELSQSLGRMRMAYRAMTEEQRNSDFGKELLASIQKADTKIKELDATIGNHQRNVGNYLGRSYNGLNMSLQQIIRELPNASMGFGMFTLAISNNIPILADQIKMAREATKAAKVMGETTTPVWKQLMKSFFSWQTALIVGVTLLTVYGKEIGSWAKQMLTGQRAAISTADATEKLNEALEKSDGKFSDNAMSIKKLASEWKELKGEAEQIAWIENNQSAFDQMGLSIRDVTSAERAFVEYTPAVIEALKSRARAEAARELAKEKYKEAFLKREEAKQEEKKGVSLTDKIAGSMSQISTTGTGNFTANQQGSKAEDIAKGRFEQRVKNINDEADTLEKEIDVYYDIAKLEEEKAKSELKRLGILKEQNKTRKEQLQAQKANLQAQLDLLNEEEAAGTKGEELRKKISDLDKRLSVYSTTKTDKADKEAARKAAAAKREAEKQGKAEEKRLQILTRQGVEAERAAKDTEFSTRQAEINAMEEGTEKVLLQIELDKEKKLEAIRREYEDLKLKRIEEAKKLWDADPKNKGVNFYGSDSYKTAASDSQYTQAQEANREAREREVNIIAERAIKERQRLELQSLYDYLKAYGTIEEQKYAIAKEYNAKIAKEQDANRKKQLKADKQSQIAQLDARYLANNIDWRQTFDGIGNVLEGIAKETLKRVNDYMKTADFKNLGAADKESYRELRKQLIEAGGVNASNPFSKSVWAEIATLAESYRKSVKELNEANDKAKDIRERLTKAEEEAAKDPKNVAKQNSVQDLKGQFEAVSGVVKEAQEKTAETQDQLREKTDQLSKGFQNFDTVLSQITSGSLTGFVLAIGNLIKKFSGDTGEAAKNIGDLFGEAGKNIGGLIGAILQIIDLLGTEPAKFIDDLLKKVADVIEAVLSQLPQIIGSVIGGVGNIIGGLFKGVGNLLTGGLAFGSNIEEMEQQISELAKSNEALAKSIDSLARSISDKDSTNRESEEAYRRALAAEKEWEQNQRKAIDNRASEWSNSGHGFLGLGGKSSFNYFLNQDFNGWDDFNKVLKQSGYNTKVKTAADIWQLTPEQMQLLRDYAPKAWADMLNTDGESNPSDLIDAYIERAGKIDELTDALNEKLTGYDWGNFKSSYVDTLKDLTSSTEDFADNIEDLLTNAILNSLVNETYKDRIKALYKMIADAASDDSEGGSMFTAGELQGIREANESLAEDLINARNALIESGVLKENSGSSSSRGTIMGATITEETASLLAGYINAIRADSSTNREMIANYYPQFLNAINQNNVIANAQLQQMNQIAQNTLATANNTTKISEIYDILHRVTLGGDAVKIK